MSTTTETSQQKDYKIIDEFLYFTNDKKITHRLIPINKLEEFIEFMENETNTYFKYEIKESYSFMCTTLSIKFIKKDGNLLMDGNQCQHIGSLSELSNKLKKFLTPHEFTLCFNATKRLVVIREHDIIVKYDIYENEYIGFITINSGKELLLMKDKIIIYKDELESKMREILKHITHHKYQYLDEDEESDEESDEE